MIQPKSVVTLSTAGVVKTPNEKIDFIMSYFFETMLSQSNETREFNVSFQEILKRCEHDKEELRNELQRKLTSYVNRFFVSSEIEVSVTDDEESANRGIAISGTVTEVDGKKYQIAESLEARGTNFKRIMKLNNG